MPLVLALPIFPASHPASIVGANELNYCVRNGNRWTLIAINTNYSGYTLKTEHRRVEKHEEEKLANENIAEGQALGLLVPVSCMCCHTSTSGLSTTWSTSSLTLFRDGRSYLRGGFTLRCFQRLSRPHVTTQLCPWQDNWCISGASIPVLSY